MDLNMTKCNEIKLKTLGDQFEKGKKKSILPVSRFDCAVRAIKPTILDKLLIFSSVS